MRFRRCPESKGGLSTFSTLIQRSAACRQGCQTNLEFPCKNHLPTFENAELYLHPESVDSAVYKLYTSEGKHRSQSRETTSLASWVVVDRLADSVSSFSKPTTGTWSELLIRKSPTIICSRWLFVYSTAFSHQKHASSKSVLVTALCPAACYAQF
jgi:hypothetical protein